MKLLLPIVGVLMIAIGVILVINPFLVVQRSMFGVGGYEPVHFIIAGIAFAVVGAVVSVIGVVLNPPTQKRSEYGS